MGKPRIILIVVCALLGAVAVAMAMDPHGFRAWRHLGQEVKVAEAKNAELLAQIEIMQRRVDALRAGPQALERAAHENGYVHADELLFELK